MNTNQTNSNVFAMQTAVVLEALYLHQVSTQDHFYRGYVGHHSQGQQRQVFDTIRETLNSPSMDSRFVAGAASNLITTAPPTSDTPIDIPNGWVEPRFGFALIFTVKDGISGLVDRYNMTGWTDTFQLGNNKDCIDPNTVFHISTVTSTRVGTRVPVSTGAVDYLAVTNDPTGRHVVDNSPNSIFMVHQDRAETGYRNVDTTHYANHLNTNSKAPVKLNEKTATGFVRSILSTIESNTMDAHASAERLRANVANVAYNTIEDTVNNKAIIALNAAGDGSLIYNVFRASFLDVIDPTLLKLRTTYSDGYMRHPSEYLDSTTIEAGIANDVHNHVTALASTCSLNSISFTFTNMATQRDHEMGKHLDSPADINIEVLRAVSSNISRQENTTEFLVHKFTCGFKIEAAPYITQNGVLLFNATVSFNRFSETTITIQLDSSSIAYPFSFGTFAGGITSPLLNNGTGSKGGVDNTTDSLTQLVPDIQNAYDDKVISSQGVDANLDIAEFNNYIPDYTGPRAGHGGNFR